MTTDLLIVAAGMGSRLKSRGNLKPLVEVGGTPLIEHALTAAFASGVTRAVVVTGYHASFLEAYLGRLADRRGWRIETVFNPDFEKPNGLSVLKAKDLLTGRFFLTMCDHMVDHGIYTCLLAKTIADDEIALGIDRRLDNPMVDIDDVTKVLTTDGYIQQIGKDISNFNAFDTGVFHANPALFKAIEEAGAKTGDHSISGGMLALAARNKALGVDIGDNNWIDVDSPEMLEMAEDNLKA